MKTMRNGMKAVVLMSLVTVGVVVMMKGKVEQSPSVKELSESQGKETPAMEVVQAKPGASTSKVKAPEGLGVVVKGEEAVVEEALSPEAKVVAQLRADDVELAYQLGQDVTELTAEGRARLKAEWEAHVQQAQQEQEQASVE